MLTHPNATMSLYAWQLTLAQLVEKHGQAELLSIGDAYAEVKPALGPRSNIAAMRAAIKEENAA